MNAPLYATIATSDIRILALDMASLLGWAATHPNSKGETSGTVEFTVQRGASPGIRYFKFVKWAQDTIKAIEPDVIIYEQALQRGGSATEVLIGFTTHLQSICYMKGIEHEAIRADHIKIFACGEGKGKASKEEMIQACITRLNISPIDDNHADALWILEYAKANYAKVPMVPYQKCTKAQRLKCKELL
jgi:Holliday junction resolvasome RuvABC endonuclease subunit